MDAYQPITILIRHALVTLPDSLTQRRELLEHIRLAAKRDSEERVQANLLLAQLTDHEKTQLSFPFESSPFKKPTRKK